MFCLKQLSYVNYQNGFSFSPFYFDLKKCQKINESEFKACFNIQISYVARNLALGVQLDIFDLKALFILKFCIKNAKTPF